MSKIILLMISLLAFNFCKAQITTTNIIEGGKTLVELISVFKKNKATTQNSLEDKKISMDSCAIKQQSDLCFKNSSTKDLTISLYKRNETGYEVQPFTMKVITKKQECWYELHSGVYKYKIEIEIDTAGIKTTFSEGELKLLPCDNMQREITE